MDALILKDRMEAENPDVRVFDGVTVTGRLIKCTDREETPDFAAKNRLNEILKCSLSTGWPVGGELRPLPPTAVRLPQIFAKPEATGRTT